MESRQFDELSRRLAAGTSRRSILHAVAAVFVGGAMGVAGPQGFHSVRAAATCQGQPYDPSAQCCTPSGIQPQLPIADLAMCPERVTNPNNIPASNGCGSG